jgi:hypothetical protein
VSQLGPYVNFGTIANGWLSALTKGRGKKIVYGPRPIMQSICGANEYAEYGGINRATSEFFADLRCWRPVCTPHILSHGERPSACQKDETCRAAVAAVSWL